VWYKHAYKRINIDNHIADWHKDFMKKFNAEEFVNVVASSGTDSVMLYCKCHIGNCYYNTKVGHKHKNLGKFDTFGEQLKWCHKKGIKVIAYYTAIFSNYDYETHPDWRQVNIKCNFSKSMFPRFGVVCPNSPYRDQAKKEVEEIVRNYDIDAFFFDMNFWWTVCYCRYCQEKYYKRFKENIPRTVDWEKPETYLKLIRWREECLYDFTKLITDTVKKYKLHLPVNHQYMSRLDGDWILGQPLELAELADYLGTDASAYSSSTQSLICKLYRNLSRNLPFEYHSSRMSTGIQQHTALKSEEEMKSVAAVCMAHNGAIAYIDAVNPDGTLYPQVYERIGKIFKYVDRCIPYIGGEMKFNVGVYMSAETQGYLSRSGDLEHTFIDRAIPFVEEINGICEALLSAHIPFDVFTRKNLKDLNKKYDLIILPNAIFMSDEEIKSIEKYVRDGGNLIATKQTSLGDENYKYRKNLGLSKVLGISYEGLTDNNETYISIKDTVHPVTESLFTNIPIYVADNQALVRVDRGKVLGWLTLPYTDRKDDMDRFCSIHSSPPGIYTNNPAIIVNTYKKGKVCYISGTIERQPSQKLSGKIIHESRVLLLNIIKWLIGKEKLLIEVNNNSTNLEATAFWQKDRIVVHLVNFWEMSEMAISNLKVKVKIPRGNKVRKVSLQPDNIMLEYIKDSHAIYVNIPEIDVHKMIVIDLEV